MKCLLCLQPASGCIFYSVCLLPHAPLQLTFLNLKLFSWTTRLNIVIDSHCTWSPEMNSALNRIRCNQEMQIPQVCGWAPCLICKTVSLDAEDQYKHLQSWNDVRAFQRDSVRHHLPISQSSSWVVLADIQTHNIRALICSQLVTSAVLLWFRRRKKYSEMRDGDTASLLMLAIIYFFSLIIRCCLSMASCLWRDTIIHFSSVWNEKINKSFRIM